MRWITDNLFAFKSIENPAHPHSNPLDGHQAHRPNVESRLRKVGLPATAAQLSQACKPLHGCRTL
jgi:hypothetical protein